MTTVDEDFVLTPEDPMAELRAEVSKLDRELRQELARQTERADQAERDLRAAQDAHREDIDLIGSVLMDEAVSRDWCGDYDEIINRLNSRLSVELPVRAKQHQVSVRITYEFDVQVLATDQEDAEQIVLCLDHTSRWSPGLPFADDRVEHDSVYATGIGVEVV